MEVRTQAVHFTADPKLLDFIEKKVDKLKGVSPGIRRADIILRLENSGQIRDKVVEIQLYLAGNSLFGKETAKTFETSVERCVSTLRTQISRYKGRNARQRRT